MIRHPIALSGIVCLFLLGIFLQPQAARAAGSKLVILGTGNETGQGQAADRENPISDPAAGEPVETIVVSLSDEQVQHLIDALTEQPPQAAGEKPEEKVGALVGVIQKIRNLSNAIQMRIQVLGSAAGAGPEDQPRLYHLLGKVDNQEKLEPVKASFSVIGLLAASLAVYWLFRRYLAAFYRRIESATSAGWKAKFGGLALRSLLDFTSMIIFTLAALALFFIFMKRSSPQSVLVVTYLVAFVIVMGIQLISRFFLAPKVPALRFVPLSDENAEYLYRWITAIAGVASFGFLTCGIFRVAGASEANHLMVVAILELVIVAMIITMILQKRDQVKQALGTNLAETGLRGVSKPFS
jgi:hypothetical protein